VNDCFQNECNEVIDVFLQRLSKQGINELDDIWIYTLNKWSKKQADRYYDLIIEEIEFIADNFLTGKSAEQTRKNYRVTK
jgi:toxin ParE1/3/4